VKTGKGNVGWVPKTSITYQKSPANVSDSKKSSVDFKVAKEQAAKWWETVSTSATPVCDICTTQVPRGTGYVLTTRQVLDSKAYHEMLKAMAPGQYDMAIANFERDPTPWLVCGQCINKYFVDVAGSSNVTELEKGMIANKALDDNILRLIKERYSVDEVRAKVSENKVWLLEDKEKNAIYPITPLDGGKILELLEKEKK
jgi:hypothetical protein